MNVTRGCSGSLQQGRQLGAIETDGVYAGRMEPNPFARVTMQIMFDIDEGEQITQSVPGDELDKLFADPNPRSPKQSKSESGDDTD